MCLLVHICMYICTYMYKRQWHPTPVLLPGKSMDGGPWWPAVHGVAKSRTRLRDFTFTFHFHALEREMATHSSVLAWRIPGTVEPGGLPSVGSHRVGHDWSDLAAAVACLLSWWCHPTISSSVTPSPSLNLSQHQSLFQWVGSLHQVAIHIFLWVPREQRPYLATI